MDNVLGKNEKLLKKIVFSVQKAQLDAEQFKRDNSFETCNYMLRLRGDMINENLKKQLVSKDIFLIPFNRCGWAGRILVDSINHCTYTITTSSTLKRVPSKKNRMSPHFLQSILSFENGTLESEQKQISLFDDDITQFSKECLDEDYYTITKGLITNPELYTHYIIAYKSHRDMLLDIEMLLLDKDFNEVEKISLIEYIVADFSVLTSEINNIQEENFDESTEQKVLLNMKPGAQAKLREIENYVNEKK